jgi:hypothetical protein
LFCAEKPRPDISEGFLGRGFRGDVLDFDGTCRA